MYVNWKSVQKILRYSSFKKTNTDPDMLGISAYFLYIVSEKLVLRLAFFALTIKAVRNGS